MDGIGLARDTVVANIDVVIAADKVGSSGNTHRDIKCANGVIAKRVASDGSVFDPTGVIPECSIAGGGVVAAAIIIL